MLFRLPAGLPDASRLRPDTQRRDRQQGHQVQAPGGGVHLGALAGEDLQGEEAGEPGAAGAQAAQRGVQAEVHLQKGNGALPVNVLNTEFMPSSYAIMLP